MLLIDYRRGGTSRGVQVRFTSSNGEDAEPGRTASGTFRLSENLVTVEVVVPASGRWTGCVEVIPVIDHSLVLPRYRCGQPVERAMPSERLAKWRQRVPHVETEHEGLRTVVTRSAEDLGALRIFDPDYPERVGGRRGCAVVHDRLRPGTPS